VTPADGELDEIRRPQCARHFAAGRAYTNAARGEGEKIFPGGLAFRPAAEKGKQPANEANRLQK
jgi:hypothetical protein